MDLEERKKVRLDLVAEQEKLEKCIVPFVGRVRSWTRTCLATPTRPNSRSGITTKQGLQIARPRTLRSHPRTSSASTKGVADLQKRLEVCRNETDRYVNDRILKCEKLEKELVAALAKRKIPRSKADECTSYGVPEAPNFGQAIEIFRQAKVSEEHIQPSWMLRHMSDPNQEANQRRIKQGAHSKTQEES